MERISSVTIVASWLRPYDAKIVSNNTIRLNHDCCPAGEDTKHRLYITCPTDKPWILLAYCHNCGNRGVANIDGGIGVKIWDKVDAPKLPVFQADKFPYHLVQDCKHHHHVSNFLSFKAPHLDIKGLPIYHNPIDDTLVIPMLADWENIDSAYLAYLERKLVSRSIEGQGHAHHRWTQHKTADDFNKFIWKMNTPKPDSSHVIICEDVLSALNIANNTSYTAYCLCGTNLNIVDALAIRKAALKVVVWLDNDSNIVVDKAVKYKALFDSMNVDCVRVSRQLDPKYFSAEGIYNAITEASL